MENYSYRSAAASSIITPTRPAPLAGSRGRILPFQRVHDDLEINMVLLRNREASVLFISFDLLFVGAEVANLAYDLAESHGLDANSVVLTASHTHFAPATDYTKPLLGRTDQDYVQFLKHQLKQLFEEVFSKTLEEVHIEWSSSQTALNVSRRRRWPFPTLTRAGMSLRPSTIMSADSKFPVDNRLDVLQLRTKEGRFLALIWKYACHPVCFPDEMAVSAEFPGYVRADLRCRLQNPLPVIFWQGFSGDVRPRLSGNWTVPGFIRAIRCGPTFRPVDMETWRAWAQKLTEAVFQSISAPARELSEGFFLAQSCLSLDQFIECDPSESLANKAVQVQRLAFGSLLNMLFVTAEVCSPYVVSDGNSTTICVGCTGDVYGYLPSHNQIQEGGYEGGAFFSAFGLEGCFRSDVEEKWNLLIKKIGKT